MTVPKMIDIVGGVRENDRDGWSQKQSKNFFNMSIVDRTTLFLGQIV